MFPNIESRQFEPDPDETRVTGVAEPVDFDDGVDLLNDLGKQRDELLHKLKGINDPESRVALKLMTDKNVINKMIIDVGDYISEDALEQAIQEAPMRAVEAAGESVQKALADVATRQ